MLSWIFISYVYLLLYCIFLLYVLCIFLITLLYCIAYFYNNIYRIIFLKFNSSMEKILHNEKNSIIDFSMLIFIINNEKYFEM